METAHLQPEQDHIHCMGTSITPPHQEKDFIASSLTVTSYVRFSLFHISSFHIHTKDKHNPIILHVSNTASRLFLILSKNISHFI